MAPMFLKHHYDVIMTDYRQHGKSNGTISFENFYSDAGTIYTFLKTRYPESSITLVGYSFGTTLAAHLSAENHPLQTILIEPKEKYHDPYLAAFFFPLPKINRFPFRTDLDVQKSTSPTILIVGTKSDLYGDATRLKSLLENHDRFFAIEGADHRTILGTHALDSILTVLLNN
jgi:pimeloyl-ACP methyl ester carboxylesterase